MLTHLDEALLHQTSKPFSVAGNTDHRFFDRYWFQALDPKGGTALILGMGCYKNMNVMDGFVSVQRDLKQYNTRVSRRLRPNMDETAVGPLKVEVVEPFRHMRLTLASGDHGMAVELDWRAAFPPLLEAHHENLTEGSVVQDSSRYDQVGVVNGWIEVDGTRVDVSDWWGVRDHSWGVRPGVGGFEPQRRDFTADMDVLDDLSILWIWGFVAAGDRAIQFQRQESGRGTLKYLHGQALQALHKGDAPPIEVKDVAHEITFIEGTRAYEKAVFDLTLTDGTKVQVEATPHVRAWAYAGTGYDGGFNDKQGLGAPRGPLHVEWDVYDISDHQAVRNELGAEIPAGHREQPVAVTIDGEPGFGHCPVMTFGPNLRYGLK